MTPADTKLLGERQFTLDDKYRPEASQALITGLQAIPRLMFELERRDAAAGRRTGIFVSGYQGSPLGALDMTLLGLGEMLARHNVRFVPGQNEELAATAVWGSQLPLEVPGAVPAWDGVVGMWYGKAPGLDRVGDVLRHANMLGAHPSGGALAISGDDPGCKSSTLPSASETFFASQSIPVLYPGDAEEIVRFGILGVELSRFTGCWVGFKIVADVADGLWSVDSLDQTSLGAVRPKIEWEGAPWTYTEAKQQRIALPPHSVLAERELLGPRWQAVQAFIAANGINRIQGAKDRAWIGIVASGKLFGAVREALHELGLHGGDLESRGIRLLHLGAPYPVERTIVERFASGLDEILVIEEKRSFIEAQIRDILYSAAQRPAVTGKVDERGQRLVLPDGDLPVARIVPILHARLSQRLELPALAANPLAEAALSTARSIYFCSGCPHNRSTVLPEGSLGGAGIGCHGMVVAIPREASRATGITQMGGEGAQWIGQAPFAPVGHVFQNVGDGTYFHSAQLAVQACIAAGVNITFKVLYNGAVSMTGGQDVVGAIDVPALAQKLANEGVRRIIVCSDDPDRYPAKAAWPANSVVWHRDRLDEAQRILRDTPGVTVIVYDQRCAAETRRLRKRGKLVDPRTHVFINQRVCEGCGDCGVKSNCLSVFPVETEFGRKRQIDQSSCNKDYTCLEGDCPSFVTVEFEGAAAAQARGEVPELREPVRPRVADDATYDLLMAGIGGTGVVTVNRVLATAAMADGLVVAGVDQTGLSQKAGPVTSHLRLSAGRPIDTPRVSPRSVDAYLVFDILTASDAKLLELCAPDRTHATISTGAVPTGAMVADREVLFPEVAELLDRIRRHVRDGAVCLDPHAASTALLGDAIGANFMLIGAAYQAGQIPISSESIEWALRLNGVAVDLNLAAFRWGRAAVADPNAFEHAVRGPQTSVPAETGIEAEPLLKESALSGETLRLARIRAAELIAYQGTALARRYIRLVEHVWDLERKSGRSETALSEAVAREFYRFLAYKDEYEVARLLTASSFSVQLREELPNAKRLRYRLHPPILRSLGLKRKIALGSWFTPALSALRGMRGLRGTPLDPFGGAHIRKVERALLADFEAYFGGLSAIGDNYDVLVETANAGALVCGYEEVKLRGVVRYLAELERLGVQAPRTAALVPTSARTS